MERELTARERAIGTRIRGERERHGWTQVELARRMYMSPSSIQRYERGLLPPRTTLARLAAVLEVPLSELLRDPDEVAEGSPALDEAALPPIPQPLAPPLHIPP